MKFRNLILIIEKFSINYKISDDPNSNRIVRDSKEDPTEEFNDELYLDGNSAKKTKIKFIFTWFNPFPIQQIQN